MVAPQWAHLDLVVVLISSFLVVLNVCPVASNGLYAAALG
jgi:hypothetical protein